MTILEKSCDASITRGKANSAVRVSDLVKNYGKVEAVRGVSLEIHPGEIFGLIGPDGAGKTSTFQILAGIMQATSGTSEIYGEANTTGHSTKMGVGLIRVYRSILECNTAVY